MFLSTRAQYEDISCEQSVAQLIGFLVVKHIRPSLSHRLDTDTHIFMDLFQDLMTLFF